MIKGIEQFGTGSGASPAIGGHFSYHEMLEKKIAAFTAAEEAILYTTGYTANSATLQCLLHEQDTAIIDMAVHASVYEGCLKTNTKQFLHNNLEHTEQIWPRRKMPTGQNLLSLMAFTARTGISPCWTGSPRSLIIMGPTLLWTTRTESAWLAIPAGA
ncbi:aminotransferase class I/II-fold pyridoxal phosphate-dependent enzyme [Mucilaginibacter humi]|uniref:aminotransferase class I/II-fold pyridoxal phosphate-dependent enzyme n=1 Tax=Mucilaginibacter humi TaxID=2732510 RepID=UPI00293BCE92|nr:aminotransferase class I/II-fold pyridoxal phosphate-dependent enzyme [Mucilaginibacter humi]